MAVRINIGDLKHQVVFKQPTSSLNDEAGVEKAFVSAITTWAAVRNSDIRRVTEASQSYLVGSLDFYIRWSSANEAITKDWLLEYMTESYTIHEIERMNQENKFIRITAKTRTDG
jgi:SPP1 family predicted phage head-tail adaptor